LRQLLIQRKPFADESLLGYLLALVELNQYNNVSEILRVAGLEYRLLHQSCAFLFKQPEILTALAAMTGNDRSVLAAMSYAKPENATSKTPLCTFNGQLIHQYVLRPEAPRICPRCLAEDSYYRRSWDCLLVTTCPKHACLLVEACPRCREPFRWTRRRRLKRCRCKYNLARIQPEILPADELALASHLQTLCGDNTYLRELTSPVASLNLLDFTSALLFLTSQFQEGNQRAGHTGKHLPIHSLTEGHQLLGQAYRVFLNWPHNYYAFLDTIRNKTAPSSKATLTGFYREFGHFYSNLFEKMTAPSFDFLRTGFTNYATQWDGGYATHLKRQGQPSPQPRYLTKTRTMRQLGIDARQLELLIEQQVLRAIVRPRRKSRLFLIEATDVEKYQTTKEKHLPLQTLGQQLNLGYRGMLKLIAAGALQPLPKTPHQPANRHLFSPRAMQGFVERVRSQAPPNSLPVDQQVSWENALHLMRQYRIARDEFYLALYEGQLRPCATSEDEGLAGLKFQKSDLIRFACSKGKEIKGAGIHQPSST
jgi:TniQ